MTEKKENWPYERQAKKVVWGIVGVWGASALVIAVGAGFDVDKMGITGDAFGAINSLFSGLAFAGLIYAIFLQRDELKLQREELKDTREELKGQKTALQAQNHTMSIQRFENTFFQMLGLYNEVLSNLSVERFGQTYKGSNAFFVYFQDLRDFYNTDKNRKGQPLSKEKYIQLIELSYNRFTNETSYSLLHYFDLVYSIYNYIASSEVSEKRFYFDILNMLLSKYEKIMIFYDAIYSINPDFQKNLLLTGLFNYVNPNEFFESDFDQEKLNEYIAY